MARILLADDDASTLDLVARALRSDGHTVVTAHDGQDALDKARDGAAFDVLVTDVQMPIIDGISLTQQMRAAQPGLRAILMSGLQSEITRADSSTAATRSGTATRFLLKPFTLEQIRSAVRAALA
jgi:two-component system, cell cycle response regulator CpdR